MSVVGWHSFTPRHDSVADITFRLLADARTQSDLQMRLTKWATEKFHWLQTQSVELVSTEALSCKNVTEVQEHHCAPWTKAHYRLFQSGSVGGYSQTSPNLTSLVEWYVLRFKDKRDLSVFSSKASISDGLGAHPVWAVWMSKCKNVSIIKLNTSKKNINSSRAGHLYKTYRKQEWDHNTKTPALTSTPRQLQKVLKTRGDAGKNGPIPTVETCSRHQVWYELKFLSFIISYHLLSIKLCLSFNSNLYWSRRMLTFLLSFVLLRFLSLFGHRWLQISGS